jgi:hypothetical protein
MFFLVNNKRIVNILILVEFFKYFIGSQCRVGQNKIGAKPKNLLCYQTFTGVPLVLVVPTKQTYINLFLLHSNLNNTID